ncbi:hypothetical protein [Teredinibacter turnerae]|uniref:hypothetical protein n=1 Tax=Teredinibacter turnerae TaxID=2426 RepID=UPI00037A78EA|nr:hypothetical protein [Teredinibacter turnerae]
MSTQYFFRIFIGIAMLTGCSTTPAPVIDLANSRWQSWQGQALWKTTAGTEIAGDVLLARSDTGEVYAELSKPPIVVIHVQTTRNGNQVRWWLHSLDGGQHQGTGNPPAQVIWFAMPDIVANAATAESTAWRVNTTGAGEISIENPLTRERVQLFLDGV